ncbi:MAG: serine hydrolase [Cyclobacteriaceae bacterium]|nr:serine hydrolase [Cyclobacteriaceae bacterium]
MEEICLWQKPSLRTRLRVFLQQYQLLAAGADGRDDYRKIHAEADGGNDFHSAANEQTWLEKRDDKNVARGYVDLYGNGVLMDVASWDRAEGSGRADGGIISTANDLRKFMKGLFAGQLVSIETLRQMKTIQLTNCNSFECEYGLGLEVWRTAAGTAYGHNGALVGIEVNVLWYEDNGAISVIYKNNGNFSDKSWLDQLVK